MPEESNADAAMHRDTVTSGRMNRAPLCSFRCVSTRDILSAPQNVLPI